MFRILHGLITGPPGGGKGTVADALAKMFPGALLHISTGAVLRGMDTSQGVGAKVDVIMASGGLVPDALMFQLLAEHIQRLDIDSQELKMILWDGIPRTPDQVPLLNLLLEEVFGGSIDYCLRLDLTQDELERRLTGRVVCSKDDSHGSGWNIYTKPPKVHGKCDFCHATLTQRGDAAKAQKRLVVYRTETVPMFPILEEFGVVIIPVDANGSPKEVLDLVVEILEPLLDS